jgi:hypothetical protein
MDIALSTTEVLDFEYLTLCLLQRAYGLLVFANTNIFCWYTLFCHFDTVLGFWQASQLTGHWLQLKIYIRSKN